MNKPKLIKNWEELKNCKSATHTLEIDVEGCNGFIRANEGIEPLEGFYGNDYYLSTHTFYGNSHKGSTKLLQDCGFDIELENWDK
jgi:hypothetical protein